MKRKRVIAEFGEFSDKFREKEKARAIKLILESESFIILATEKEGGSGISCIEHKHLIGLAFQCNKMERELLEAFKKIGEDYEKNH
jgi:hypothetical protein